MSNEDSLLLSLSLSLSLSSGLCDSIIQDIIYGYLVLPNRLTIPLVGDDQLAQLRFPLPQVCARTHTYAHPHTHRVYVNIFGDL